MQKTQPPVITPKTVGLEFLERIIQKNPSTHSEPLPHFNGFHKVVLVNAKGIFDHVHEKDGLKATVILDLWKAHCSDRAICALIAKPFLEGLFDAHTQGNDEADITTMFAQNIHFISPEDGTPHILTPLGI